jgi:hypothetical protein
LSFFPFLLEVDVVSVFVDFGAVDVGSAVVVVVDFGTVVVVVD